MKHRIVALLILVVFIVGCDNSSNTENNPLTYIDFVKTMEMEQTWLQENQVMLIKQTAWNNNTSVDTIDAPNWGEELFFLKRLKISPASWQTDYSGETLSDNSFRVVPNDPTNKIQEIKYSTDNAGQLVSLYAVVQSENRVTGTLDTIDYNCKQNFSFHGMRQTMVIGDENYSIKGKFAVANN